ncbi:MAG: pantothenate metabolism flavoprotein [Gammaproteobacteria bacterium]|nr:pantothenate metabolism flavoprotein [Gammaproteobacteria bacterium]
MANLTIRNIDEELKTSLRVRAARNGCSMEQEVREILRRAVLPPVADSSFVERIRARFVDLKVDALPIPKRRPARVPRAPAR